MEIMLGSCAGHIVFQGPREAVVEFFESCGFRCPERKGVPDFLQEVTSRNDQKVCLSNAGHRPQHASAQLLVGACVESL